MYHIILGLFALFSCFFSSMEGKGISREKRLLLVTGCSRSGTVFMSKFLQLNGVYVAHENDAPHGTVSWLMAVDDDLTPWGPGANLFRYRHTFHQVRHPLKAIASISNEPKKAWQYICKHIPAIQIEEASLVKAAKYWYYWNLKAENKAEVTYRLEKIEEILPVLSRILGIYLDPLLLAKVPKDFYNTRNYTTTCSWEDLKAILNPEMYAQIVGLAERYGYDVSEAP